ncbi:hypothetical protein ACIPSE_33075 [Streptomyces sp. NPDC090106]|uniref:hypothetical protein n=1 Tax=Streptomyces sp. NPDC090106 TaxID=3365946 RepID=UPI00381BFB22
MSGDPGTVTAGGTTCSKAADALSTRAVLARFREHVVGPSRCVILLSVFRSGVLRTLRETPGQTADDLSARTGVRPDVLEHLLFLLVEEGFVAHDRTTGGHRLDGLAGVPESGLARALVYMNLIKGTALRQLFHLTESARTGTVVGLRELHGAEAPQGSDAVLIKHFLDMFDKENVLRIVEGAGKPSNPAAEPAGAGRLRGDAGDHQGRRRGPAGRHPRPGGPVRHEGRLTPTKVA